jgi:hypothetical protein
VKPDKAEAFLFSPHETVFPRLTPLSSMGIITPNERLNIADASYKTAIRIGCGSDNIHSNAGRSGNTLTYERSLPFRLTLYAHTAQAT